jgi:signal transduction histidine kinase
MASAKIPLILIIAGDHDLVFHTQQALQGERISMQRAFSHRDALYAVGHNEFDLALVDAAMTDRRSGEATLAALVSLNNTLPLVAIALNDQLFNQAHPLAKAVITKLDKQIILHTVMDVLRGPEQADGAPGTAPLGMSTATLSKRIDEIQILFELSKSLTEVLELTEVLNRVVEAARRLTNADEGMILLPDEEAHDLYLRARVGIDIETARNFRIKTQDTIAGQVFQSGEPVLIGDKGPQKVKTEYFVNSLLYVPILLQGIPIGVLGVNNKNKQDKFEANHQDLLLNLAAYAAIAIENARIHEETLQRTRELQTLVDASQVLNSSLSLQETLPNICEQLAQVLKVNRTEIFQWERDTNHLQTLARFYGTTWRLGQAPIIEMKKLPALKAGLDSNKWSWIKRGDKTAPAESKRLTQLGAAGMLIVPIYLEQRPFGAVCAFYVKQPASQPGPDVAVPVVKLAMEALASILSQKTSARSQAIFQPAEAINKMIGADWCQLGVVVNDGADLAVHLEAGTGVWLSPPNPTLDLTPYPDWMDMLQLQTPINEQFDSKKLSSAGRVLLETTDSRAVLALPMVQRGKPQGLVVFADTERSRVFSAREIDLGKAIVGQAATALDNSQLVTDLERSLQNLKDAQDRLVQTARLSAMGELAAVVAHQINNPLTTIVVDSELLLLDEPPDSRDYETLQAISRAGKRAAGVAKRLLAISRPTDPNAPTELIDAVDTIKGVLSLVKTHIERDHIRITIDLPESPLPMVNAIRGQLEDVWLNLLLNAHDALKGKEDAQIGISLKNIRDQDRVEIVVWDNGPGIPDEIKEQIFNPFFTTKPVGEGTGLGLHVCRQVVKHTGGEITLESEVGQGTRFLVRLPVASWEE